MWLHRSIICGKSNIVLYHPSWFRLQKKEDEVALRHSPPQRFLCQSGPNLVIWGKNFQESVVAKVFLC